MKTKIMIRVYDIQWDLDEYEGKKPPQQIRWEPDLCELEDGLRNGLIDMEELIGDHLNAEYPDCSYDNYAWCFC